MSKPKRNAKESENIEKLKHGADLASEIFSLVEHVTELMQKKDKTPEDEERIRQWQAYIKLGKYLAAMVSDAATVAEQKDKIDANNKTKSDKVQVE